MTTLRELRALCEEATPGPWFRLTAHRGTSLHADTDSRRVMLAVHCADSVQGRRDAEFMAAARTALPHLLSLVDTMRRALEAVPVGPGAGVHVSGCASQAHRPPSPRPECTCHVGLVLAARAELAAAEGGE